MQINLHISKFFCNFAAEIDYNAEEGVYRTAFVGAAMQRYAGIGT
jgi:hypothetical protein